MSELTEAEKRQLLREKRKAKLSQGGGLDRLKKITGENNSKLSTDAPTKEPTADATTTATELPTQGLETRINAHDDPVSEIPDPLNEGFDGKEPDLDQLIASMFNKSAGHENPNGEEQGVPELMRRFSSILQGGDSGAAGLGAEAGGINPLDLLNSQGGSNIGKAQEEYGSTPEEIEFNKKSIAYKKHQNEVLKAKILVVRLVLILSLLFVYGRDFSLSLFTQTYAPNGSSFMRVFLTLELIFQTSLFFFISKNKNFTEDSLISKLLNIGGAFIPATYRNLLQTASKYQVLLSMFLFDLSIVVVVFAIRAAFNF
ncbi:GET complex subunit get2 [Komagataella kurtzmanii]|nr:GET complex subunit get2 [Komagataella kurtzmanii]